MFAAVGITASIFNSTVVTELSNYEPLGFLLSLASRLVPYLLIIGVFTFLYSFVPHTRVTPRAELNGAVFAGELWQNVTTAFSYYAAGAPHITCIYLTIANLIY